MIEEIRSAARRTADGRLPPSSIPAPAAAGPPPPTDAPAPDGSEAAASLAALAAEGVLPVDVAYPGDPGSRAEADASPFAAEWHASLQEELKSIRDMGVYELVPRSAVPVGRKVLKGKPVYRLKRDENGTPVRFRLVGYAAASNRSSARTTIAPPRLLCAWSPSALCFIWQRH